MICKVRKTRTFKLSIFGADPAFSINIFVTQKQFVVQIINYVTERSIGGTIEVNTKYTKGCPQEEPKIKKERENRKWRKRHTVQVLKLSTSMKSKRT